MYTFVFTVTAAEAGVRLDAAVAARCPDSTRALIRRAIAAGRVTVNGQAADKGGKLRAGDAVAVRGLPAAADARVFSSGRWDLRADNAELHTLHHLGAGDIARAADVVRARPL